MDHYKQRQRESIELIRDSLSDAEFKGFLKGNVLKYLNRYEYKGDPIKDLAKAIHYTRALVIMEVDPECRNPFQRIRDYGEQEQTEGQRL